MLQAVLAAIKDALAGRITEPGATPAIEYVASMGTKLIAGKCFELNDWNKRVSRGHVVTSTL